MKKTLAREWLYLLSGLIVGLVLTPHLLMAVLNPQKGATAFYKALFDDREWWIAWLLALAPYLLFQLVRSIVWAAKEVRS